MSYKVKINRAIETALSLYPPWLCRWEYSRQKHSINERPIEFGFVFNQISQLYPTSILDVGTGKTALPHLMRNCGCLVTATDNIRDYWSAGMSNRHYRIIDDDICNTKIEETFDMVTCISVLEHVIDHQSAVKNMFKLLKPGGHLIITCPYTENSYIENVYELEGSSYGQDASYTTQSYSRVQLEEWLNQSSGLIVKQEYWQVWEGKHWTVGNRVHPPISVNSSEKHQLTCLLLEKAEQH